MWVSERKNNNGNLYLYLMVFLSIDKLLPECIKAVKATDSKVSEMLLFAITHCLIL